jgi:nitrite reductase/ring-hydroxylating ferredoxin subunit
MKNFFRNYSQRLIQKIKACRGVPINKSLAVLGVSSFLLNDQFSQKTILSDSSSAQNKFESSLEKLEKYLDSKRGKVFKLGVGDLGFIPRGSSFSTRIKHPTIGWVNILFIKDLEGQMSVFRANCPYDQQKIIRQGIVFGNKLVCEHHGCEFNIKSGEVDKYPAMANLVKLKIVPVRPQSSEQNHKSKALYFDEESGNIVLNSQDAELQKTLISQNRRKGQGDSPDGSGIDLNVYKYQLPQNRVPQVIGNFPK